MAIQDPITVLLEQEQDFSFRIRFQGLDVPDVLTDEAAPLGHDAGPNPLRLLLAGIANCLAASLLFALRKHRNTPGKLRASITAIPVRNAEGRWRVPRVEVALQLPEANAAYQNLERVLDTFEEYCLVTQSVREGIDVQVSVTDAAGHVLRGDKSIEAGA
ncbi:OsmC family protein [Pseudoxanthomonas spadix BD-a59]|uniref:OsmC family protein n=1 Tax=Pseudoxanthomonas spadix (strain BD-a59) TaxID=1045855 RepID=G7USM4_PSEUP|nr:OsmC family protein [Pseudoxanthomonas spadix]AER57275.1 OsmC family protein [Pseudoxanthomonas spadix BD-a59]